MVLKRSRCAIVFVRVVGFLALIHVTVACAQLQTPGTKAEKTKVRAKEELFENQPLERWSTISGNWQVNEIAEAENFEPRIIYRSPEEPAHLGWVGLWKAKDGSINTRFSQITGDPGLESSYEPWYGRANFTSYGVKGWEGFAASQHLMSGPRDALSVTRLNFITMATHDNGATWQKVSAVPSERLDAAASQGLNLRRLLAPNGKLVGEGWGAIPCRGGRIVDTVNPMKFGKGPAGQHYMVGLHESFDNGKTWTPMQWISGKFANGKPFDNASEEHSFVELGDGRLLFMIRSDEILHPVAAWLTRHPNGQYTSDTPVVETTIPFQGLPSMVRTGDGTIWYWGARHYYSLDDGRSWHGLPDSQVFSGYYGKMLAEGNRVLGITQKNIGDSPYPPPYDASIGQIRFLSRRVGIMRQTASDDSPALIELKGEKYSDLHLRADVKLDKAEGLAFHITPDGKSYYAFMVVMPGTPVRTRWEPPPVPGAKLTLYFPGILDEAVRDSIEKGFFQITPQPIAVLARVDDGRVTVLRALNIAPILVSRVEIPDPEVKPGRWGQLQVKVRGDLIQAAFSNGSSALVYLGVHDARYKEGAIGLLTDGGSQGEFKELNVWSSPQMIRDLWTPAAEAN